MKKDKITLPTLIVKSYVVVTEQPKAVIKAKGNDGGYTWVG